MPPTRSPQESGRSLLFDMSRYKWTVLFAAWLGWGFDVFDGFLFNYVAPNCVPTLLGLKIGSVEAKAATLHYTGIISALLLIGWGVGGIFFGHVCDRIGRTKTLVLTMLLYAVGTAACALAPTLGWLMVFRTIASLGIGGEWAAGAAMVAEVVPERRRVEAGALLYTAAPLGGVLAAYTTYYIQGVALPGSPETAWRYVFLCGLAPAIVAAVLRFFIKEPERWKRAAASAHPRLRELFAPGLRHVTFGALAIAIVALTAWWSCNSFISVVVSGLANKKAVSEGLDPIATQKLIQEWVRFANNLFNFGGLIGSLATVPFAKRFGRKTMYALFSALSAASILATFGLDLAPHDRLYGYLFIGISVFGIFGSFTFYLPELFPTRLRGTGSGFCYNAGRFAAAIGPIIVGHIASLGQDSLATALRALFYVGFVPLVGLMVLPWVVETKGRLLSD